MSDYEFTDTSDSEHSDAETEWEEYVSDFEDDDLPMSDIQSACLQDRYESCYETWLPNPPPMVQILSPYKPLPGEPKDADSEAYLFGCFISVGIIKMIVKHTNEELDALKKDKERKVLVKTAPLQPTNDDEIKAFFGLWLDLGIAGFQGISSHFIFSTESGSLPAHLTFSSDRYRILPRAICFESKLSRRKEDKLAPIREVFEKFITNWKLSPALQEIL